MYLSKEQESALNGEEGAAWQWSISVLAKLGDRSGAKRLVPVTSVHIPDWCKESHSDAWEALRSRKGDALRPVTVNPVTGGCPSQIVEILESLGPNRCYSFTCAPYLSGNHPGSGEVVAWGGRAASAFANSVLGARSDHESFESTAASALTGLTPERGLHLDENRRPTVAIVLPPSKSIDYALLGRAISIKYPGDVPLLCGARPTFDEARRLALAINAHGDIPLFKMQRATVPPPELETVELDIDSLGLYDRPEPDLVILGCPHLSEQEINRWSKKLAGQAHSSRDAWFFTSRLCMDKCPTFGAVLRSRGRTFVDTCPLSLKADLHGRTVACDSPSLVECLSKEGITSYYASNQELFSLLTGR